jgi:DNA-binding CsgD family transcriptional regulator
LVACGEWDEADAVSAAALRSVTSSYPHQLLVPRGELEVGRGNFEAARAHYDAARVTLRLDRDIATFDTFVAELALWERRWKDADDAVNDGLGRTRTRDMAQIHVWLAAKGLRAQAELAGLARARRDDSAVREWIGRAGSRVTTARRAADAARAITPTTDGWLALAEAEYERARAVVRPEVWSEAARTWDSLERPPLAAYCRWRQAEALVAIGASRTDATTSLRDAYTVAQRLCARPLQHELELLAERARLDLTPPPPPANESDELADLALTAREREVLSLVARGFTNREIAAELTISAKTASVHVSHILRKLDAPNRREAAAIAHRYRSS